MAEAAAKLSIDIDDLTIGEIETIEDIIDDSIDSIGKPGSRKGKFLKAVAYVVMKRDNPEFTLEDAANVRLDVKGGATGPKADAEAATPNRAARRAQSRKPA